MSSQSPRSALMGIGCATPPTAMDRERWVSLASALAPSDVPRELIQRIAEGTQIEQRGCVTLAADVQEAVLRPDADPSGPSTAERGVQWAKYARPLARQAAQQALQDAGVAAGQITHIITATCTGFVAPGVDQWLIWDLGLNPNCRRTHIGFMGCHAAINALAAADAYARADPSARVLVTTVEISTVHLHYGNRMDRMIANALFADGASAAVVGASAPASAPRIQLTASTLVPSTSDEMGWVIGDNGFEMTLAASVPSHLRREVGPWIRSVLGQAGLTSQTVGGWAIHPGGPRIVEAIADTLDLPPAQTELSRAVLRQHGNMSSATVLFIVRRLRDEGVPLPWVAMSFGPGLAGEAVVFSNGSS